jgi:decaprenylphospho-beta-D-ribofuranose 2-oxidase
VLQTADMADDRWTGRPAVFAVPPVRPSRRFGGFAGRLARPALLRVLGERHYRAARAAASQVRHVPLERFLFQPQPLSYRLTDRGRWTRFDCVLPADGIAAAVRRLLDIARRGAGSVQAEARAMGNEGRGLLSFARPGIELLLELPARAAGPDLMHRLERETLDRGGRVQLADDVHLTDHGFAAMYPRLEAFRTMLARVDPEMRLQSDLARRLRLRDYVV